MSHTAVTEYMRGSNTNGIKWTEKDRRFCFEYSIDFDGIRAARAAGCKGNNKVLSNRAALFLKKQHIKHYLGKIQRTELTRCLLTREEMIIQLRNQAFLDVADLTDSDGKIIVDNLRTIPESVRKCIEGIKVRERRYKRNGEMITEQTCELKLASKIASQDMLTKYFGWYAAEKHEILPGDARLDFDALCGRELTESDPIQARIEAL